MRLFRTHRLFVVLAAAAVAMAGVSYVAAGCYIRWSDARLPEMAAAIGEVRMERAARLEAAGKKPEALELYEAALRGHFHGPQNRAHCEKRAGILLLGLGHHKKALDHLRRAQSGDFRSLNGYGPWFDACIALEQWEEAREVAEAWLDASHGVPASHASARAALAELAVEDGDLVQAETLFESALELEPAHFCRKDLARIYLRRGFPDRARETLADYLATSPPNDSTADHWAAYAAWQHKGRGT